MNIIIIIASTTTIVIISNFRYYNERKGKKIK